MPVRKKKRPLTYARFLILSMQEMPVPCGHRMRVLLGRPLNGHLPEIRIYQPGSAGYFMAVNQHQIDIWRDFDPLGILPELLVPHHCTSVAVLRRTYRISLT